MLAGEFLLRVVPRKKTGFALRGREVRGRWRKRTIRIRGAGWRDRTCRYRIHSANKKEINIYLYTTHRCVHSRTDKLLRSRSKNICNLHKKKRILLLIALYCVT